MIKIGVCEYNLIYNNSITKHIKILLNKKNINHKILQFYSGENLLDNYPKDLNLIFLGNTLNKLNGIDIARSIRRFDSSVEIIFTTNSLDYVFDAFEVKAYRYLLRPLKLKDVDIVLTKFFTDCLENSNLVPIKSKNIVYSISTQEIFYLEVSNRSLLIHTKSQIISTNNSLNNMEKLFKHKNFFRCHNSFLVNLNNIKSFTKDTIFINNKTIPISRRRYKDLSKIIESKSICKL